MGGLYGLRAGKLHPPEAALAALAGRQELVVSTRQLLELRFSREMVATRCAAGRLFRLHRGVYALVPQVSRRGQFFAAVLAYGPLAALSHLSAAHDYGVRRQLYGPVHITVPYKGPRSRPGIIAHSAGSLDDVEVRGGLRVTSVRRTLTDLADVLGASALQSAVSTAERLRLVDRHTFAPLPGRRRPMTRPHRFTRSQNERALVAVCEAFRLPMPDTNVRIDGWEVDALWPGLALEIDAWYTHGDPVTFERDRAKDEHLELQRGLMVRRITDVRLHYEPEVVAGVIERALRVVGLRRGGTTGGTSSAGA